MPVILCVDENESVRDWLDLVLGDAGYEVHLAEMASDLVKPLRDQYSLDLLITDFEMPEESISGLVLAKLTRNLYPDLPIIFLSAIADTKENAEEISSPMLVLNKPMGREALLAAVQGLLGTEI